MKNAREALFIRILKILLAGGGVAAMLQGVAAVVNSVSDFNKNNLSKTLESKVISKNKFKYSFWCDPHHSIDNRTLPATIVTSDKGDIPIFTWEDKSFGDKWSPLERCQVVSRRLQVFVDNHGDFFKYITSGKLNNYPVFCISGTGDIQNACSKHNLLITLSPKDNISKVLEEIIAFPTEAIRVKRGNQAGSEIIFNLEQYIREAPRRYGKKRLINH